MLYILVFPCIKEGVAMQAPWEYFEHFSDLVYVSDIDTHELV